MRITDSGKNLKALVGDLPKRKFEVYDTIEAYNIVCARQMFDENGYTDADMYKRVGRISIVLFNNGIKSFRWVKMWYSMKDMSREMHRILNDDGDIRQDISGFEWDNEVIQYLLEYTNTLKDGCEDDFDKWWVVYKFVEKDSDTGGLSPYWDNENL